VNLNSETISFNNETDSAKTISKAHIDSTHADAIDVIAKMQSPNKVRRFGFSVGQINMLVPEGLYCELLTEHQVTPLPNSPEHVIGLINLRGNIVPVYSISKFLSQPKLTPKYAYLIGAPEEGAALLINDKPSLIDLTDVSPRPDVDHSIPEFLSECIGAAYSVNGRLWLSLNHEGLFSRLTLPA